VQTLITECSKIKEIVGDLSLVRECDKVRGGAIRISTPFLYPNGDSIDIFLDTKSDVLGQFMLLSDYGQTGMYLHNYQVELDSSKRRSQLVEDIISEFDVKIRDGSLQVRLDRQGEGADISEAIMRLSQACLRVSDLVYHQRMKSLVIFREEIDRFLKESLLPYKADGKVAGKFGRSVKMDFTVKSNGVTSYLLTMAARTDSALHIQANEVFGRWSSIEASRANLLTVTNVASAEMLRSDDSQRIKTLAPVFVFPQQEQELISLMTAAA
jgi:hypothetical protein